MANLPPAPQFPAAIPTQDPALAGFLSQFGQGFYQWSVTVSNAFKNIQLTPGPAGPTGATGARGPVGPTGATGPAGTGTYTASTGITLTGSNFTLVDPVKATSFYLLGTNTIQLTQILANGYTALYAPDGSGTSKGLFLGTGGNNVFIRNSTGVQLQDDTGGTTYLTATSTGVSFLGTNTNDSAAAGNVGEFVSSSVASGSAVSLGGSLVATNITSISLTKGDWDVVGSIQFLANGATVTGYIASASTTSATLDAHYNELDIGGNIGFNIPPLRVSINGTTTVYLVGDANYTVATPKAFGIISARRVR